MIETIIKLKNCCSRYLSQGKAWKIQIQLLNFGELKLKKLIRNKWKK